MRLTIINKDVKCHYSLYTQIFSPSTPFKRGCFINHFGALADTFFMKIDGTICWSLEDYLSDYMEG